MNGLAGYGNLNSFARCPEDSSWQISMLLYCMSDNAEDTLAFTYIPCGYQCKYAEVKDKSDAFFQVQQNVIFECAWFNWHNQEESELTEQLITSLNSLADSCAYDDLKDDLHMEGSFQLTVLFLVCCLCEINGEAHRQLLWHCFTQHHQCRKHHCLKE